MASPQDAPAAEVPIRGKREKLLWHRKVGKIKFADEKVRRSFLTGFVGGGIRRSLRDFLISN
jgi:hypothetical protein